MRYTAIVCYELGLFFRRSLLAAINIESISLMFTLIEAEPSDVQTKTS